MHGELPQVKRTFYSVVVKRMLDIILSGAALICLSPILLVIGVLELIFHGWPPLFVQKRPGWNGEIFKLYKFRSMTNETDENGDLLPGEQRLTSFGRIIRRFSLDEFPEFWCVFTGKMSIIGPRPLLPEYMERYTKRQMMRHAVRPGLACPPHKSIAVWSWEEQFENDVWYVENVSFLVDIKMLMAIVRSVFRGSKQRTNDTREMFMGSGSASDSEKELA